MNNFSAKLKRLRKAAGYTQSEAARLLGISASAVGMYEQGRREPDFETTQRICELYSVSPSFLMDENSDTPSEISDVINQIRAKLKQSDGAMFEGVPITSKDTEMIFDAMLLAAELVMKQRKEESEKNTSD